MFLEALPPWVLWLVAVTGVIGAASMPFQFGNLTKLTGLWLANNSLSGCVPAALQNIPSNDLNRLGLPVCAT